MKRMSLLLFFVLIVSNISARIKIVSVTVEYRYLAYDFMSCFAEYDLHDNQLVLKEQPDAPLKFDEVIDCAKLDSIVRDLVKHKGKEIISSSRPLLSSKNGFGRTISIIHKKGYIFCSDFFNKKQCILCYNGHYYSLPSSKCDILFAIFPPIFQFDRELTQ